MCLNMPYYCRTFGVAYDVYVVSCTVFVCCYCIVLCLYNINRVLFFITFTVRKPPRDQVEIISSEKALSCFERRNVTVARAAEYRYSGEGYC